MSLIDKLSTWEEFSICCDECSRESTRSGSRVAAVRSAEEEGFVVDDDRVLCGRCRERLVTRADLVFEP